MRSAAVLYFNSSAQLLSSSAASNNPAPNGCQLRQLCGLTNRSEGVLFYSIRPSAGPATPLTGAAVEDDLPTQTGDEALLGQIDGVESGEVAGWACLRGYMSKPLEVCPLY